MEFVLETRHTCFLCRQGVPIDPANVETDNIPTWSLRAICRYLRVNCNGLLIQSIEDRLDQEEAKRLQGKELTFWAKLCDKCATLVRNLSEMIFEQDVLQMLIQDNLQTLQEILRHSNSSADKKKDSDSGEGKDEKKCLDTRLVELLRPEIKRKCTDQVELLKGTTALPRVYLTRCNVPKASEPIKESVAISEEAIEEPTPRQSSKLRCVNSDLENKLRSLVKRIFPRATQIHVRGTKIGKRKCKLCGKFCCNTKVRTHIALDHPDKLLDFAKLAHTSDKEFQRICKDILDKEARKTGTIIKQRKFGTQTRVRVPSRKTYWKVCQFCKSLQHDGRGMQCHLITCHFDKLAQELESVQHENGNCTTKNTNNPIQEDELSNDTGIGMTNILVSVNKNDPAVIKTKRKRKIGTMATYPTSKRRKTSKIPLRCSYCNQKLQSSKLHALEIHTIHNHPEEIFTESRQSQPQQPVHQFRRLCRKLLREEVSKGDGGSKCSHCPMKLVNTSSLTCHLAYKHREILVAKLKNMMEEEEQSIVKMKEVVNETNGDRGRSADLGDLGYIPKQIQNTNVGKRIACAEPSSSPNSSFLQKVDHVSITPSKKFNKTPEPDKLQKQANIKPNSIKNLAIKLQSATCPAEVDFLMRKQLQTVIKQHCPVRKRDKQYQCGFCEVFCNTSNKIGSHLADEHPDKLLWFVKQPGVSDEHFRKICVRLMDSLICGKSKCGLCNIQLTYSYLAPIKHHLLTSHSVELIDRLKLLLVQESSSATGMLETSMVSPSPRFEREPSMHYRNKLKLNETMKYLMTYNCSRSDEIGANELRKYNCGFCGMLCCNTKIRAHFANAHAEKLLQFAKLAHIPDEEFKIYCNFVLDTWFKCSFCINGADSRYSRYRMMQSHSDKLVEKLKEMQELRNQEENHENLICNEGSPSQVVSTNKSETEQDEVIITGELQNSEDEDGINQIPVADMATPEETSDLKSTKNTKQINDENVTFSQSDSIEIHNELGKAGGNENCENSFVEEYSTFIVKAEENVCHVLKL